MTFPARSDGRIPVCYLAPWVDFGGSDKGTIDWFRWIDRDRFAPILITTQPSQNRRLAEVYDYTDEVWALPEFLAGQHMPEAIFDILYSRGVQILHIMNSRIGYDLLPDLASLRRPPAVVVQLHVEEPDKSGYVRYVTTRYGNLVDAFSVSSEHLARTVGDYHINPSKIHVIPTGVDAEHEFNPAKVTPVVGIDAKRFNILFPGRLTDQKDPLLMVEVIRQVVASSSNLHIHVVGDGPLESDVQALVADYGLAKHFSFHEPSRHLAQWYTACDLLLMTSVFEGVPYVLYEAMSMGLPIVAPALPGNIELMADTAGVLVEPRDNAGAYAHALVELINDRVRAKALGHAGRERVLEHFSLQEMGTRHSKLYADLITSLDDRRNSRSIADDDRRRQASRYTDRTTAVQSTAIDGPLLFPNRPMCGQPPVSVIIPCFNHGAFLIDCVDSIVKQDYKELEILIVDDGSTDPTTIRCIEEIGSTRGARAIHQPRNLGPSAARNRAINEASGRYILPVDADNVLLPGAVASLVAQLQSAGEHIGYIYPNCQFFGTRDEYFQPPRFNLALLLNGNYCDTCSLIDRDIFDAGFRYAEDIQLGHEDWDFVLMLAARGVRGEPASAKTLLYRKHGFTRSDAVEYGSSAFHEEIQGRHPGLYGSPLSIGKFGRWWGLAAAIKAKSAPSLSLISADLVDFATEHGEQLLNRLEAQSCGDFELIAECPTLPSHSGVPIRRIPPGLCADQIDRTNEALRMARSDRVLLASSELIDLLAERPFVERLHRTFLANRQLEAIAFADGKEAGRFPYRLLEDRDISQPAHVLVWRLTAQRLLPSSVSISGGTIVERLAQHMGISGVALQWRHARGPNGVATDFRSGWLRLRCEADIDTHMQREREMVAQLHPALPTLPSHTVKRWSGAASWMPPATELLTRHHALDSQERIVLLGRESPPGFVLERDLGSLQRFAPPGTVRLVHRKDSGFQVVSCEQARSAEESELGHLEQAPLPMLQAVERAVLSDGSDTLVAGDTDPLRAEANSLEFLGFIEAFPNLPTRPPDSRRGSHAVIGLLRCVDQKTRRHVYRIGSVAAEDELVGELGALHLIGQPDSVAVWLDEHEGIAVDDLIPSHQSPNALQMARWCLAPFKWRNFGHVHGRIRSVGRRLWDTTRLTIGASVGTMTARQQDGHRRCVGYLHQTPRRGRRQLFAAIHPVNGDCLLTRDPLEAADMGYGAVTSVGYILDRAPATGTLAMRRVSVPWASRFGLEVRRS
jgi:glycosyltransferase involved in cell wall biosynthesis